MLNVVERALRNIFEPMTQDERTAHILYLVTHFESTPTGGTDAPTAGAMHPPVKPARRWAKKGVMHYYIKQITGLDETKKGAYCFGGPFVPLNKVSELVTGTPLLVGTDASPKKYCLAKANEAAALTFTDAEGREITVNGAEMILLHTDVKELIDALKALHLLKS